MSDRVNTAVWFEKYGRWQIKVQKDGVRRTFTSAKPGRTGQREANAKADAWLSGGIGGGKKPTVNDIYPAYLAAVKVRTGQSNWRPLDARFRCHILPGIGPVRLDKLTDQKLQAVLDAGLAAGLSKKYLSSICGDMRSFLKYCRMAKLCTYEPQQVVVPAGARKGVRNILQPDDLVKLFQCTNTTYRRRVVFDENVHAYRFQVLTGLRPGELIGMAWSDIVGDYLRLQRAVNIYGEQTRGKNENAVRSMCLSPAAKRVLRDQYEMVGGSGPVFPVESERAYYGAFQRFCSYNGMRPCSLYELRHTFVSIVKLLPAGEVKDLVGHSENMDTFGIYAHALQGDAQRTALDVEAIFAALVPLLIPAENAAEK